MSYITKDEVKKYLGVNFTVGLDTFVDLAIAGCQQYVEKLCGNDSLGRRLFEAYSPDNDVIRKFDGNGDIRLFIGDIFSLASLEVDGVALTVDEDYFIYPLNGDTKHYIELTQAFTRLNSNSRITGTPTIFEKGQANIVLTGKFYYSLTCPSDIKLAMLKLVGGVIKENIGDEDVREKKQEAIGDWSATFQDIEKVAHTLKVDELLKGYSYESTMKAVGFKGSAGIIHVE